MTDNLKTFGWDQEWQAELQGLDNCEKLSAGRVTRSTRNYCQLLVERGEVSVRVPGRFRHKFASKTALPVVGDWVAFKPGSATREGSVAHVLQRKTLIIRQAPGRGGSVQEQAIAANVDSVFIVTGLDRDYNLRRIERYLTLVANSGARPVLILNKLDLCDNPATVRAEVEEIAAGAAVELVSARDPLTAASLADYLVAGQTIACIGSSGAGKSTLINNLIGYERQATGAVSDTLGKGKHTTTHRELIPLEMGTMLIDNPGMRELQPHADAADLSTIFTEVEALARDCRYHNCQHETEPDCAVKQAVEDGTVTEERYQSFLKLQLEISERELRQGSGSAAAEKQKWKPISKALKKRKKDGWISDDES